MTLNVFNFKYDRSLAVTGVVFLLLSLVLFLFIPFNKHIVLGINSLIKPLKFSISIWIFLWSMALILPWVKDRKLVHRYVLFVIISLVFEQTVITVQAWRGTLSHFNIYSLVDGILFTLMGIFIVLLTLYTMKVTISFHKQEDDLHPTVKLSVLLGLLFFLFGSLVGGIMSAINSHVIGGDMGGPGMGFTNWSKNHGDLRIAHFFGLHSLQMVPLAGLMISRYFKNEDKSKLLLIGFCLLLTILFLYFLVQALMGQPFLVMVDLNPK